VFPSCLWKSSLRFAAKVAVVKKKLEKLDTSSRGFLRENSELEEDILALESSMAERDRLADLQGTASLNVRDEMSKLQSKRLSTHRRLLDLAKAQVFPKYKIPSFNCLICIALSLLPTGIVCQCSLLFADA
jgi:hypothetical protein